MSTFYENIDIVYRDNNCLDEFHWQNEDATLTETFEKALETFSIISALWIPESWFVESTDFNLGVSQEGSKKITIPSTLSNPFFRSANLHVREELKKHSQSTMCVKSIQTSLYGWNRIIIPKNTKPSDDWQLLNIDNQKWPSYEQRSAPIFNDLESIWLKIENTNPATHFSLVVEATGYIRLRTSLGVTFFNSENEIRNADHLIRGVKLKEWHKFNQQFYDSILASLYDIGWDHIIK